MSEAEQRAKPSRRDQTTAAQTMTEHERPLSPMRAFVVQFRDSAEDAQTVFSGRVEHMVSGRAARFESSAELLAFLVQALGAQPSPRAEDTKSGRSDNR